MKEWKMIFLDVRKAHLNGKCDEEEWVELPEEMWEFGRYARLRRWLYGMRKAAVNWEEDYAKRLEEVGFRRGRGAPTVFLNKMTEVRIVVHGDTFVVSGCRDELEKVKGMMEGWYAIKDRGIMGGAANEIKEVTILGRTVRWTADRVEYEADGKHRLELLRRMGLDDDSKGVVTAVVDKKGGGPEDDDQELVGEDRRRFRGEVALVNYLGQDRSDLQYAGNRISREMNRPTVGC